MNKTRKLKHLLAISTLLAMLLVSAPILAAAMPQSSLDANTKFYIPKPNHGALEQIATLTSSGNKADANLIKEMINTPQAIWFTKGTPKMVMQDVRNTVQRAADKGEVAVLVAYNIPGRDCANLSAGGATTEAEYKAWIDGFAAGIGNGNVIVIVEPDGLGLLPSNCGVSVTSSDAQRYRGLNYAVDTLEAMPNVSVYLDGTHSAWLNVHDASTRLMQAGVQRAHGFFLNVSNYQYSPNLVYYGTWISKCIARLSVNPGAECPDQYWNGGPHPAQIADLLGEWTGVALNPYGTWSNTTTLADVALNVSGENTRYADTTGLTHFVIDTSRNGVGPWQFPTGTYPDAQDWCNPPGRGLGPRPTANTGNSLVDAYLWIKIPGESDGQCTRGTAAAWRSSRSGRAACPA